MHDRALRRSTLLTSRPKRAQMLETLLCLLASQSAELNRCGAIGRFVWQNRSVAATNQTQEPTVSRRRYTVGGTVAGFFRIGLPEACRSTFRWHLSYALLDAVAGGILLNAPMMALKRMNAPSWQLPLRELYSGIGMLLALYLGGWMANRRKLPFVVIPGITAGMFTLLMPLTMGRSFWFLTLLGLSAMFEFVTRPATTSVLRLNYPVEYRGRATGEVRKWTSLAFMASSLASAALLQQVSNWAAGGRLPPFAADATVAALLFAAGGLSMAGFACFSRIEVQERFDTHAASPEPWYEPVRHSWQILVGDVRYRRYIVSCFFDGFCAALYLPLLWAFLQKTLGYDYVGATALMHVIPAFAAFCATGWLGSWFDRTNPWFAWGWIRLAWGFDALLLAVTPLIAQGISPAVFLLPIFGRVLRGVVQGGQFVMWWQIGVTHFAPPGSDTSRYMGIMAFLAGAVRLTASVAGITLTALKVPAADLLLFGGLGVIAVGVYSLFQGMQERRNAHLATIAAFESQFASESP